MVHPNSLRNFIETSKRQHKEAVERYEANPKICPACNKALPYEKRLNTFCNHSCAASYNNLGIRRHGKEKSTCPVCGNPVKRSLSTFCSKTCWADYCYISYITRWLNGEESGTGKGKRGKFDPRVKRWLFETNDGKCEKCSWGEVNPHSETIPLEVDHIDGNRTNNRPENLRLLCPNCHSLTPTHCGLNVKNRNDKPAVRPIVYVRVPCSTPGCKKTRKMRKSRYDSLKKAGQRFFYCSRPCMGKHYSVLKQVIYSNVQEEVSGL